MCRMRRRYSPNSRISGVPGAVGQPAHVINLTLLPMSMQDIAFLDHHLGTGRVLILSRGYGNCRITNTKMQIAGGSCTTTRRMSSS